MNSFVFKLQLSFNLCRLGKIRTMSVGVILVIFGLWSGRSTQIKAFGASEQGI